MLTITSPTLPAVIADVAGAPEIINDFNHEQVTDGVLTLEAEVIERTPVGATGQARAGWTHDVTGGAVEITGRVFNRDVPIKIMSLENGRAPGKQPPLAPILLWVSRKLGGDERTAFLVARAIGRRGTKGAHMVEGAFNAKAPEIVRRWEAGAAALAARIFGR